LCDSAACETSNIFPGFLTCRNMMLHMTMARIQQSD
jgi:hypothetical protein